MLPLTISSSSVFQSGNPEQNFALVFTSFRRYIEAMSDRGKLVIYTLGALMFCAGVKAAAPEDSAPDTSGNPYQGIVDRNVFALKPPPAPQRPEDNKPPPPTIKLTGITTILGNKRVLMNVQMPAKPPEPAKLQSFILTEGQRDGEIEVLEI